MAYQVEVKMMDGSWKPAGRLMSFVNGAWITAEFASPEQAQAAIDREYSTWSEVTLRIIGTRSTMRKFDAPLDSSTSVGRYLAVLVHDALVAANGWGRCESDEFKVSGQFSFIG